jgi:hypothetical protein
LHHHENFDDTQNTKEYLKDNRVSQSTHIQAKHTYTSKEATSTYNKMTLSLHTLPVELVYRILDNLDDLTLFMACRNICTRLNAITDTYYRYQVIFAFIMKSVSHYLSIASFFSKKYIILIHFLVIDFKVTDFVR